MKILTQCVTFILALVLASILLFSVTALAIAPINVENRPISQIEGIIAKLKTCESGNRTTAIHLNDGAPGLHSMGVLQFQRPTFTGYWKKLINENVEEQDIDNLIWDPEAQTQLAKAMLEQDMKNLHHWTQCSRSLKLI